MDRINNNSYKKESPNTFDRQYILEKLKPVIASKPEILFAYLFGSVAAGTAGQLSDVDIAVYLDFTYQNLETGFGYRSNLISELSALLKLSVDVVILNDAEILLKYQVIKNGILIFSRSNADRREFHEKTLREYLDFKPFIKVQQEYLHKRILNGSFGGGETG